MDPDATDSSSVLLFENALRLEIVVPEVMPGPVSWSPIFNSVVDPTVRTLVPSEEKALEATVMDGAA